MEEWMTSREVCDELGITLRALYELIDAEAIPAWKKGKVIRLRREDVEGFDPPDPGDWGEFGDGGAPVVRGPRPPAGGPGTAVSELP